MGAPAVSIRPILLSCRIRTEGVVRTIFVIRFPPNRDGGRTLSGDTGNAMDFDFVQVQKAMDE